MENGFHAEMLNFQHVQTILCIIIRSDKVQETARQDGTLSEISLKYFGLDLTKEDR